ncbi:SDR family NAD(P)-dependent oxidoreductase [Rhodococcus wratislaviensis]|uniref:SDR family NAD(P)-dependent oxidoreductase n=1 Tax=Rhodococcus wratislaviensis TaxID=44752 RepID=UPI000F581896
MRSHAGRACFHLLRVLECGARKPIRTHQPLHDEPRSYCEFCTIRLASVVTGAGRGIGRATAITLAAQGADVAVVDIDLRSGLEIPDEADDLTTDTIKELGARTIGIEADLTEQASATRIVSAVREEWGGFDRPLMSAT